MPTLSFSGIERSAGFQAAVRGVRALSESPEMTAIQKTLPISFVGLALGLVAFMASQSGTLLERFSKSFAAAFGVMSILLVVVLAYDLAKRRAVPVVAALAIAIVAFAISVPFEHAASPFAFARALGSSGLFLAIGVALLSVAALSVARKRAGAVYGTAIAALAVDGGAAILLAAGVSLTGLLDAAIAPLGNLGDSLEALLVITLVETLLWTIGIHGPALLAAVVLPVYIHLQVQNTEALAHGGPLPHIVTVSMFLFVFPGGAGATLPLVLLLLRSKVKRVKRIAIATLLPSLANTNEPLMFGLPVVLNPALGVPFVVTPLVLAVVSYQAMALGFVNRPAYYIPSPVPIPFGAFAATKDWRAVILMLVNIAIGIAIYAPFARVYERQERARAANEEAA